MRDERRYHPAASAVVFAVLPANAALSSLWQALNHLGMRNNGI
jgi:hypothetical protein